MSPQVWPRSGKLRVLPAVLFLQSRVLEDFFHLRPVELFDAEKIFHDSLGLKTGDDGFHRVQSLDRLRLTEIQSR